MNKPILIALFWLLTFSAHASWRVENYGSHFVHKYKSTQNVRGRILLLHGCKQSAQSIIAITKIETWAKLYQLEVVVPDQNVALNPDKCWNFFLPTNQWPSFIWSELSFLRSLISDEVPNYLLGLSSGAGMALNLYYNYANHFHGVLIHSGVAFAAATNVLEANQILLQGPDKSSDELVRLALSAHALNQSVDPYNQFIMLVHGVADQRVYPINTEKMAQQMVGFHQSLNEKMVTSRHNVIKTSARYKYREQVWLFNTSKTKISQLSVEKLQHAWSGGSAGFNNSDENGPDVLALFFQQVQK